ncbi:hypothetical protein [Amycolatopsis aidingensis]|uniref:hypothetical protein n=1 Tax=Amycolatopsis aidingensis TaxID=2842453 RepID=UPI001C0D3B20|nr:hypothetical protein [Amycolatopsis aidingensis]
MLIGLAVVLLSLINWDVSWLVRTWYLTLPLMLFFAGIVYRQASKDWLAAGATWFQHRTAWVDLYELTEIEIGAAGAKTMLRMRNASGQNVHVALNDLQKNQAMWDLVYNGILHSVVIGHADPPAGTRTILKLPGGRAGRHREA